MNVRELTDPHERNDWMLATGMGIAIANALKEGEGGAYCAHGDEYSVMCLDWGDGNKTIWLLDDASRDDREEACARAKNTILESISGS